MIIAKMRIAQDDAPSETHELSNPHNSSRIKEKKGLDTSHRIIYIN